MVRRLSVVALTVLLTGCGSHDKAGGVRAPHQETIFVAMRDGTSRYLDPYAAAVAPGLRVRARTGWRPNDPRSEAHTVADVRAGRLKFALVAARAFDRLGVDAFAPALAPLAVASLEAEQRVLEGPLPGRALPAVARLGVVGVALLPGDLRHPVGLTRPLVRPRDFAGARIGIRDSALSQRTFAALGAHPVLVAGHFTGFDGVEADLQSIESNRLEADVTVNVTLWPRLMVLIANPRAWIRLGAERQAALRSAGRSALPAAIASLRRSQRDTYGVLCRRGDVSFTLATPADVGELRSALVARDPELVPGSAPEPAPPPCRGAVTRAAGAPAVDGVWTFDSDEADLLAMSVEIDDTPENWGHHVLVFAHGRFAVTQENAQSCTWVYGTYAVRGDRIGLDVVDGGGHGPSDATNRPGEHFEYVWSRFKDTLRASLAPGASPAVNFIARPWRWIGDDPRRAPLSKRCPPPSR
jgi:hypothetical protein